jgi:flagellar hook-associated protein 3 FlgL
MRIATSQYQSTLTQSLQGNQERITHLTAQMASGKRLTLPSDDPVDSVRLARLDREESAVTQYRANVAAVDGRLAQNEGYLSNIVNDMMSGRDLMVWALDGSNTSSDLQSMITPLQSFRDSLLYSANTIDSEGRYIFSGTATDQPAISYDPDPTVPPGSRYSFTGNTNDQMVVIGNGLTQVANQNLDGLEKLLNRIDAAIAALEAPGADVNDPAVRAPLKDCLDGFDGGIDLASGKVARIGGSRNMLATLDANHANMSLSNQTAIGEIGALDMAKAATDLGGYTTALQATYKSYARIGELSLFAVLG